MRRFRFFLRFRQVAFVHLRLIPRFEPVARDVAASLAVALGPYRRADWAQVSEQALPDLAGSDLRPGSVPGQAAPAAELLAFLTIVAPVPGRLNPAL